MDLTNYHLKKQLLTTVTTEVNKVNSTVTVVSEKGSNYQTVDDLYDTLGDLVNQPFRAWYCGLFHTLGQDTVLRCAATARQEAKTDKRKYFSWLLKNPDKLA